MQAIRADIHDRIRPKYLGSEETCNEHATDSLLMVQARTVNQSERRQTPEGGAG